LFSFLALLILLRVPPITFIPWDLKHGAVFDFTSALWK
jgi:hypothetical protein